MPAAERQSPRASCERRPHFFKVLMGDFKKRLVKDPAKLLQAHPLGGVKEAKSLKEASMAATLEGPSGRTWLVVIRRSAEGTFFTSGWPKFVQDQALRELEFLVFRYDGNTRFTAMVFDTSGCEREDLLLGGAGAEPRTRGKKRGRPSTASRGGVARDYEEQGRAAGTVKAEAEDADELALCVVIPAPTPSSPQQADGEESSSRAAATKTRSLHDDLAEMAEDIPASVRRYKGYVSRRRPVTGAELQRAMELAYAFRSSLPYCVMRMSTMHVYYSFMMRFPTGFSRQHLPRERTDVVLRDPGGKAWVVLYIPNTRDRLSRGWCAFARGNCLEEGDYCVFELVAAAEFRVHIFRVVDPPVPAVRLRTSS
ncbi:hypothetical protein EJB05_17132, partial [Eragrostis curvula]